MSRRKIALLASTALTVAAVAGTTHAQSNGQSCDGLLERVEALPQNLPEDVDWTIEDVRAAAESGDETACAVIVADVDRMMQENGQDSGSDTDTASASDSAQSEDTDQMRAVESAQTRVQLEDEAVVEGTVYLDRERANVEVSEGQTEIMVTPNRPDVTVNEQAAQITVREQPARITVEMAQPTIRIEQPAPEIIITMPEPGVDVADVEPEIEVRQAEPTVTVSQASPTVDLELQIADDPEQSQGVQVEDRQTGERFAMGESREMPSEDANVSIARSEPIVRMQRNGSREPQISFNRAEPTLNYERAEPEVSFSQAGEPAIEFAQAGEPSVTIRRAGEDGESAQQADASGSSTDESRMNETGDPSGSQMASDGTRADGTMNAEREQSELAEAENELERAGENVETAAESAGNAIEAEAEEAGNEIAGAAQEAGSELEEGAENVEMAAENAGEEIRQETAAAANEVDEEVTMSDGDDVEQRSATADQSNMADAGSDQGNRMSDAPEGTTAVELATLTMDDLDGAPLYGADNERIGEVSQGVLADDGLRISGVVLEVGGFLGLGEHEVLLELENVQFVRSDMGGDIRAYVDMTEEEIEAMPEWEQR